MRLPLSVLFCFALVLLVQSRSIANEYDELADQIAKRLGRVELNIPFGSGSDLNSKRDIAVLNLQLEEMRLKYARELQLESEGIAAANQVQLARTAYERIQVLLAARVNRVAELLPLLEGQRKLANTIHDQVFARVMSIEHPVGSIENSADSMKPAPSEWPGKPPGTKAE